MLKGHCECNRVSYEADCEVSDFSHCHCSQCRRLHGAAFATFASIETDKFRYLSGEEEIKKYASSDDLMRVFCVTVVQIFSSVLTIIPRFFISLWELLMATPLIQRLTISMLAQRHRGMK